MYLTKDKTAESAIKGVEKWSHTYGLPLQIRSDQGPCFVGRFTEWNRSVGINHCVSSAYNPQSNGAAERGVASIKAVLTKIGKKGQLTQEELDKIVFKLNAQKTAKEESALERFYMRPIKTYLPELIRKQIDHQALIAARRERQRKLAAKLGRRSKDNFKLGDNLVRQDVVSLKWRVQGWI